MLLPTILAVTFARDSLPPTPFAPLSDTALPFCGKPDPVIVPGLAGVQYAVGCRGLPVAYMFVPVLPGVSEWFE